MKKFLIYLVEETVDDENFLKSETQTEAYESTEVLKYLQDCESDSPILYFILNDKEITGGRIQAKFKRSRHSNIPICKFSQEYYERSKQTIRATRSICLTFRPNDFRDVKNLYQYKAFMNMTLFEFKIRIFYLSE